MFRVLSEEESKNVVRWTAPEHGGSGEQEAATQRRDMSEADQRSQTVIPLLGSASLKRQSDSGHGAPLKLEMIEFNHVRAGNSANMHDAALPENTIATASADMLQASYEEGYERGLADNAMAIQQEKIQELSDVIESLGNATSFDEDAELEQEVIGLSIDIARLVIRQELSVDPAIIVRLVKEGLRQLHNHKTNAHCVYLHPEDAQCVRQHASLPSDFNLIDDPALARGSCRIESGASVVGVGVDDWLQTVAVELGFTGGTKKDSVSKVPVFTAGSSDSLE